MAHSDTMNYAIELINPEEVENVKVKMIKLLIFNKRLDTFRLFGEFRIAIDGSGIYSFNVYELAKKGDDNTGRLKRCITLPFLKYYHSVRNFARRLTVSFRNFNFSDACSNLIEKIQIRFSSA